MDQIRKHVRRLFTRSNLDASHSGEKRPGQSRYYEPGGGARYPGAANGHPAGGGGGANQYAASNGHQGAANFRTPMPPPTPQRAHSETRRRAAHEHRGGRLHHQSRVFSLTDVSTEDARDRARGGASGGGSQANLHDAMGLSESTRATVLQIQFSMFKAMLYSVRASNRSTSRYVYLLSQESFQVLEQQLAPSQGDSTAPPAHRVDWPLVQWAMRMLFVLFNECFGLSSTRLPLHKLATFVQHLVRILEIEARAGTQADQGPPVPLEVFRELVLILHKLIDHRLLTERLTEPAPKLTKYLVGLACFKYVPVEQELSFVLVRSNSTQSSRVCHYETRDALTLDKIGLVGLIARLQAPYSTRFVADTLAELVDKGDRVAAVFALKFYHFATQPERQIRLANPAGQCPDQSLAFAMPRCSPLGQLGPKSNPNYLDSDDLQLRQLAAQIVGSHAYFYFNGAPPGAGAGGPLSNRAQLLANSVGRLVQLLGAATGGKPSLRLTCAASLLQCLECQPGTFARKQVDRLPVSTKRNLILRCQELIRWNLAQAHHAILLVGKLFDAYPADVEPMAWIFLATQLKFLVETRVAPAKPTLLELLECMLAAARCCGARCNYSNLSLADRQRISGQLAKIGANSGQDLCLSCTPELRQLDKLLGAPSEPAKVEPRAAVSGATLGSAAIVGAAGAASPNAPSLKPPVDQPANLRPTNLKLAPNLKPANPKPATNANQKQTANQRPAGQKAALAEPAAKPAPIAMPSASQTNGQ